MAPLTSADGQTAVCATHGGTYQILFARTPLGASAAGPTDPASPVDLKEISGTNCINHPTAAAVARCQTCQSPVCATCVFSYPGGTHLCPNCVANYTPRVSPKRIKLIVVSMALGVLGLALLGLFLLLARNLRGASDQDKQAVGMLFIALLVPAIGGLGVGLTARDRRAGTPVSLWIAIALNAFVIILWALLIIVGLAKQAGA